MKNFVKNDLPLISIIIACRNEENFISKCLDSILNQDYPKEKLEILVVDGMSADKTREIVREYRRKYTFISSDSEKQGSAKQVLIRLLENREKITPKAMNIGIKESKGEVIIFVNSHGILDREFLKWNIYYLEKMKDADAVGGKLKAVSEKLEIIPQAITFITDSFFGSGGIRYRKREKEGFVKDTLPYCAYRREVFQRIGLIDEELLRGQDAEFNLRLIKKGGKIYFSPKIKSYLYTRPLLSKLWKQQFQYGYFKVKIAQKVGFGLVLRQHIPPLFVLSLILTGILGIFSRPFFYLLLILLLSYALLNIVFSLEISFKRGFKYFFASVLSFFVLHFSYGLGFLKGIFDFLLLKKEIKKDVGITR